MISTAKEGMTMKINIAIVFKVIFLLTLCYYLVWILFGVKCAITGIDSGWVAPALSSGEKDFGFDGFSSGIGVGIFFTFTYAWFVPLYQVIYLITCGMIKLKKRIRHS